MHVGNSIGYLLGSSLYGVVGGSWFVRFGYSRACLRPSLGWGGSDSMLLVLVVVLLVLVCPMGMCCL